MLLLLRLLDMVTEEKKCLKDIAILTGGQVISEELGLELLKIQQIDRLR